MSAGCPHAHLSITGPPKSRKVFLMFDRTGVPKNFSHRSRRIIEERQRHDSPRREIYASDRAMISRTRFPSGPFSGAMLGKKVIVGEAPESIGRF
jgi:hypothetical protein